MDDDTKHIWLYAKGIYPHSGDLWQDLRKVIGKVCALPPELVDEWGIINSLASIVWDIINQPDGNPRFAFLDFVHGMRRRAAGGFERSCVEACLATIAVAKPPRHIQASDADPKLWLSLKGEEPHGPKEN